MQALFIFIRETMRKYRRGESMAVETRKILLKVLRDKEIVWVHFCYIPNDLYEKFFCMSGIDKRDFASYLSKWVKEDFGVKLNMVTYKDLETLRTLVKEHFESAYEELYGQRIGVNPEIRGWLRLWVSQNIMKELRELGQ